MLDQGSRITLKLEKKNVSMIQSTRSDESSAFLSQLITKTAYKWQSGLFQIRPSM